MKPISIECADKALRSQFPKVERWDYTSDGGDFPKETNVAQFAYYQSRDGLGRATLEIGRVRGADRVKLSFTGIGAQLPQSDFPPALEAMAKAEMALTNRCGLELRTMRLSPVGQQVDALDK